MTTQLAPLPGTRHRAAPLAPGAPLAAAATASGRRVLDSLVGLARDGGRGVLVVTHDPIVAARCDRVVFLCDGHLVHSLVAPSVDMVTAVLGGLTDRAEAP